MRPGTKDKRPIIFDWLKTCTMIETILLPSRTEYCLSWEVVSVATTVLSSTEENNLMSLCRDERWAVSYVQGAT